MRFCLNLVLLQQVRPDLRSISMLLNDFCVTQNHLEFFVIIINQSTLGLHVVFETTGKTTGTELRVAGGTKESLFSQKEGWAALRTPIPEGPALVTTVLRIAVS